MDDEIEKYNGGNKPEKTTNKEKSKSRDKAVLLFIPLVLLCGLGIYAANGLLPAKPTVVITTLIVSIFVTYQFIRYREKFSSIWFWISWPSCILFFGTISFYLYQGYLPKTLPFLEGHSPNGSLSQPNDSLLAKIHKQGSNEIPRPYPGLQSVTNITPILETTEFHANAIIENFGRTPAFDFKVEFHLAVVPRSKRGTIVPKNYHPKSTPVDLLPGQTISSPLGIPASKITPELIDAINKQNFFIVLWIAMEYKDDSGKPYRPRPVVEEYVPATNEFMLPID